VGAGREIQRGALRQSHGQYPAANLADGTPMETAEVTQAVAEMHLPDTLRAGSPAT
jgi:hypothetical protein